MWILSSPQPPSFSLSLTPIESSSCWLALQQYLLVRLITLQTCRFHPSMAFCSLWRFVCVNLLESMASSFSISLTDWSSSLFKASKWPRNDFISKSSNGDSIHDVVWLKSYKPRSWFILWQTTVFDQSARGFYRDYVIIINKQYATTITTSCCSTFTLHVLLSERCVCGMVFTLRYRF